MPSQPDTADVRRTYRRMAKTYDRQMGFFEWLLFRGAREWATSHATGRTLEIGIGTGLNLPHYPAGVHVVGVDLTEQMLELASKRAAEFDLADRVELRQGDVQALGLPDASVDTVISTFTFCAIPDPSAAAREVARVLRPGGLFVLAEHGRSTGRWITAVMRGIEKVTIRFDADHLTRDPRTYVEGAGFSVEQSQRSKLGIAYRIVARKPG